MFRRMPSMCCAVHQYQPNVCQEAYCWIAGFCRQSDSHIQAGRELGKERLNLNTDPFADWDRNSIMTLYRFV